MTIPWDQVKPPWLGICRVSSEALYSIGYNLRSGVQESRLVLRIRGSRMEDYANLLNEISAALQFPWYFGHNLNALDECLADLDWLPAKPTIIVVEEFDRILAKEAQAETERIEMIRQLCDACAQYVTMQTKIGDYTLYRRPVHILLNLGPGSTVNPDTFGREYADVSNTPSEH